MTTHREVYQGQEIAITFTTAHTYHYTIAGVALGDSDFENQISAIAAAHSEVESIWQFVAGFAK